MRLFIFIPPDRHTYCGPSIQVVHYLLQKEGKKALEREGFEVIKALRDDFPGVKIIAVSGGGQ